MSGATTSSSTSVEQERKFEATEDISVPEIAGTFVADRSVVRLTATYWDTVHRRLLRWGHTLRHRSASNGSEDRWTMKLRLPSGKDSELRRAEVNVQGDGNYPPRPLRHVGRAVVRRAILLPIARIVTDRRRVELVDKRSGERVELSDDRVSSVVGLRRGPSFRQIEVEALSPGAGALVDEVSESLVRVGATPTDASKLAVALGDTPEPEIVLPDAAPDMTIRDVVRTAVGTGAMRLIMNDPVVRIGGDAEAIHQARVATRRLRSDLKTLEPMLDPAATEVLREELRWVGMLLGRVRDIDVLIDEVMDVGRDLSLDDDAISAITSELDINRAAAQEKLVEALASDRYVSLVHKLVTPDAPPLDERVDADRRAAPKVRKLVRRSYRRLETAIGKLEADPDDAALHEIRKRAKRARYAAELAAGALDADTSALASRLADIQDILGEVQDAVVANERLTMLVVDGRLTGRAAFAAGELTCVIGRASADARERWQDAWEAAQAKRLHRWLR